MSLGTVTRNNRNITYHCHDHVVFCARYKHKVLLPPINRRKNLIDEGSLKQRFLAYTSLLEDVAKPVGLARQVTTAGQLFASPPPALDECDNPILVEAYIHQVSQQIKKEFGQNDFLAHWKELPLPWEVLSGTERCTRQMVEEVCRKHNLDPEKSGWTMQRPQITIATFRPTPELVHGVSVTTPYLATFLRKAGFFSAKHIKLSHLN